MSYIDIIKEKARSDRKTIVLPETNDKRTLIAASHIIEEGIANIIMVGNEEKIMDGAGWLEVDLTGVRVIDPTKCEKLDEYVQLLYETRKHKGMTPEKARQILLTDNMTFGVIMVKANDADGMVAGACHATADTLRQALWILQQKAQSLRQSAVRRPMSVRDTVRVQFLPLLQPYLPEDALRFPWWNGTASR